MILIEDTLAMFKTSGVFFVTPGMIVMWVIGFTLLYLSIKIVSGVTSRLNSDEGEK